MPPLRGWSMVVPAFAPAELSSVSPSAWITTGVAGSYASGQWLVARGPEGGG